MSAQILLRYFMIFAASGGTVVIVYHFASVGNFKLSGLLTFIPIVSLWSYIFIGLFQGRQALYETVYNTFWGIPPLFFFLLLTYLCLKRFAFGYSLLAGMGAWLLVALVMFKMNK